MSTPEIEQKIDVAFEKWKTSKEYWDHPMIHGESSAFRAAALPLHKEIQELRGALHRIKNLEIMDYGASKLRFQTDIRNIISTFKITHADDPFAPEAEVQP